MIFDRVPTSTIILGGSINNPQNKEYIGLVNYAVEQNLWLHNSPYYPGNLETIAEAIKKNNKLTNALKSITKISINNYNRGTLRDQVELTLKKTGLERINIVQLCCNPSAAAIKDGMPFVENMKQLVKEGKVETYYPEVYWQYSPNMMVMLEREIFPGFIFYYNIVNRETEKNLFCKLENKKTPFVALKALGGGPSNYYESSIHHNALKELKALVRASNVPELEFRISFLKAKLNQNLQACVIGTRKLTHLKEIISIFEKANPLSSEIVLKIEKYQDEIWKNNGCGNGLGLHRKIGRMAIKLAFKNAKERLSDLFKNRDIGSSW